MPVGASSHRYSRAHQIGRARGPGLAQEKGNDSWVDSEVMKPPEETRGVVPSRRPQAGILHAPNWRDATVYVAFLGLHVNTTNPPPNALVSTSSRSVLIASSNRRVPLPRTTGYTQNLNSSARSCSISVFAS